MYYVNEFKSERQELTKRKFRITITCVKCHGAYEDDVDASNAKKAIKFSEEILFPVENYLSIDESDMTGFMVSEVCMTAKKIKGATHTIAGAQDRILGRF